MATGLVRRSVEALVRFAMSPVYDSRGWFPVVREPYTGAWQRNDEWTVDTVLAHHAVYTCITLIASDIGKLRPKLVELSNDGIWSEVDRQSPFLPVLRRPNHYQNHIQFKEWWITSKLVRGNAYILKERDARGVVRALYLLDPSRVKPLVTDDGDVFYELNQDNLGGVTESSVTVPASEIIHDRMNCLFHPLVGVSPIFASGAAANIGLNIQSNSANFFGRGSNPSGVLTAPGKIDQETATRLADTWQQKFSGQNSGAVAVLGNDLKYQPMRMGAVESQLIEQLQWTATTAASCFHVPAFKIGVGDMHADQKVETLNQIYYSDCLQYHIESMELCLDEGLGLTEPKEGTLLGVELDLDGLLRMDTASQVETLTKGIRGGLYTPNGARKKANEKPLEGGDTIYLQHQDYPMEKVYKRTDLDAAEKPALPAAPEQKLIGPASDEPDAREWTALWLRDSADVTRETAELLRAA